jgi:hypothetical protein
MTVRHGHLFRGLRLKNEEPSEAAPVLRTAQSVRKRVFEILVTQACDADAPAFRAPLPQTQTTSLRAYFCTYFRLTLAALRCHTRQRAVLLSGKPITGHTRALDQITCHSLHIRRL